MFKRLFHNTKKPFLICAPAIPVFKIEKEELEEFRLARGLYIEDNWQRVKSMFELDEYGNIHPEMAYAVEMAQYGLFCGGFGGGIVECIRYTQEFVRNNDTNVYWTRNEALRKLSQISMIGFFKGAWRSAPKYCLFFTGFSIFSSCCELYRNKTGVIENTVGGAGIGAILRSHCGVKGMISGGVVGGILGTIYGLITELVAKITNKDKTELKYISIAYGKYKKELRSMANNEKILKEKEAFEKRFAESNEDETDRLKNLGENPVPAPASEEKNVEKKSEKTS